MVSNIPHVLNMPKFWICYGRNFKINLNSNIQRKHEKRRYVSGIRSVYDVKLILFLGLNKFHFLRVSKKSLRTNVTSRILSSTPPWHAISLTLFKLVARGNNEEKYEIGIFPLSNCTFYLNQSFPFYFLHTCHFGSRIII